jgi:hypothetical protein
MLFSRLLCLHSCRIFHVSDDPAFFQSCQGEWPKQAGASNKLLSKLLEKRSKKAPKAIANPLPQGMQ